jgi:hypothetical protein
MMKESVLTNVDGAVATRKEIQNLANVGKKVILILFGGIAS